MIDLTNKSVEQINELIQKYTPVLELFIEKEEHIPYLAYIIDLGVNHIKTKHNNLTVDWKSWTVFIIEKKYFDNKIRVESDIITIIDNFVEFFNKEYQKYIDDLGMFASEYDRDRGFIYMFLRK